jgi:membrane complex biogenesis BtpA family protein
VFADIFKQPFNCIGMVHLLPLPGVPHRHPVDIEEIIVAAERDARALQDVGFHGILMENYGDAPFYASKVPVETVAALTAVARELRKAVHVPLGVNVLRNDPIAALAIAHIAKADFIRVNIHMGVVDTDQGRIEGIAADTLRYRAQLGAEHVNLFTDARVKHAQPVAPFKDIFDEIESLLYRGDSDAIILTGPATGKPTDIQTVKAVREKNPQVPILVGSGVTVDQLPELVKYVDGVIVGTSLKVDGKTANPVDPVRAKNFMKSTKNLL